MNYTLIAVMLAFASCLLCIFLSQGAKVINAWRRGVIASDSLLKGFVERAVDPAEFARLVREQIRRLGVTSFVTVLILWTNWQSIRALLQHGS